MRFEHGIISPAYKTYNVIGCSIEYMNQWVKWDRTKQFFYNATTVGASECRRNVDWNMLYSQSFKDLSYRSKLQLYEKENSLLGCIIEIPISNIENTYVLRTGNREYKQRLNNIPFTLWYLKKVVQNYKKIKNAHFTGLYLKNITAFA